MMTSTFFDLVRRHRLAGALSLIVLSASAVLTGGCSGPKYGSAGHTYAVNLASDPPGADVYLVPVTEWNGGGGEAMLDDLSKLEKYRRAELTTPAEYDIPPKMLMYVAVKEAPNSARLVGYKRVTPKKDGQTFSLALKPRP